MERGIPLTTEAIDDAFDSYLTPTGEEDLIEFELRDNGVWKKYIGYLPKINTTSYLGLVRISRLTKEYLKSNGWHYFGPEAFLKGSYIITRHSKDNLKWGFQKLGEDNFNIYNIPDINFFYKLCIMLDIPNDLVRTKVINNNTDIFRIVAP